jgi:uncharacterized protein involved in outer membrane biogenesis
MRVIRRALQVFALVGTLLIGVLAVALIVSQTAWFKDWLRRYVIRQADEYLHGELTIGRLGGNLFFGVDLGDVALDVSGERIVAVKDLEVDYSVFDFISRGIVLDDIRITEPRLVLRREADGRWNLASLVRAQEREADREGPARPVAIGSIGISNGEFVIDDRATGGTGGVVGTAGRDGAEPAVSLPGGIRKLDARMSFNYEPVRFTLVIDHLSFRTTEPALDLNRVRGTIAVRDEDLHLEGLSIHTAESALEVDGAVERYASTPVLKLTAESQGVSLPEIARIVPALRGYTLHPAFSVRARGPLDALALNAQVRSEAGEVAADVTVDAVAPERAVRGQVSTTALDLAPLLRDPSQRSHITGQGQIDLAITGDGLDGARGTFTFAGPRVAVAGYEAANVRATGRVAGPRITVDGRANAYGGTATARGFIVTPAAGRALRFSLDGRAAGVDLRRLPPAVAAPKLATNLDARYHVEGSGGRVSGRATLAQSTVEGATIAEGTTASFAVHGPGQIEYAARGAVRDLNLQRLGRALEIPALADERFEGDVRARFDVRGRGTSLEAMQLDASGQLADSTLFGGQIPQMDFETSLAGGSLHARAKGELAGFDPAALSGRPELEGQFGARVDLDVTIPEIAGPIDPAAVEGRVRVDLAESVAGRLRVDGGTIDASAADGIADVREFVIDGPDLSATAQGQVALTEAGQSSLKYTVRTSRLEEIGAMLDQPLAGAAILEGTVTGNRAELRAQGTLDGSNLTYGGNGALDLDVTFDATIPDLQPARVRVEADTHATFARLANVEIQEIEARTTYEGERVSFVGTVRDQGRELETAGDVVLHPDHSEIHLPSFSLRTEGVEWRLAGADAAVQYGQDRLSFQNVTLQSGDQELSVEGALATGGEKPSGALDVRASNVDLAQLQQILLADRGVGGRLSADARVSGVLSNPDVEGKVSIVNGSFRDFVFQSLTSDIEYTATGVVVDARLQQTPEHWLTVAGRAPMTLFRPEPDAPAAHVPGTAEDQVDLRIASSEIDLGVVQGFTDQLTEVRGSVQANVRVTGSGRDPHMIGTVAVRNGAFAVPAVGTSYRGLDTTIQLSEDKIVVPRFQILDEHKNPLTIAGELAVHARSVGAFDVRIEADSFELIDNHLGDVGVDAQLRVTGELRRPRIEGEIKIEDGRIEVDEVFALLATPYPTDITAEPRVEPGAAAASDDEGAGHATRTLLHAPVPTLDEAAEPPAAVEPEAGTLMDAIAMDVRLQIPDNLVLRGQDLRPGGPGGIALGNINITVGGNLRATKAPYEAVRLVGTVNTVRGFYEFQGRRFELQRDGRIRFAGLDTLDPTLDLRAVRVISGVEAQVQVRGTAREPELQLSSNPPLDEADILSLIVFNRSINALNEGERVSLAQRAGAIAGGFVTAPLAQSIGRALDVDLFEIEPIEIGGQLGAGITLGQQVGERLFVKFHQEFGPQDTSEFIIEYQLASFLRLQATGSPGGGQIASRVALRRVERAGADLIFFFSY